MSPPTTLQTLPPELLLQILLHLPLATLTPLSQTSKHLSTFLHTHAATICNTFILTHYPTSSTILHSTYHSSGWYLPTHSCILSEEQRLLREKILSSGCTCASCRLALQSTISLQDQDQNLNLDLEVRLDCKIGSRAPCKAPKEINASLRLSAPGPQYALFLEKYAWEVETRWAMSCSPVNSSTSPASSASSPTSSATATAGVDGNGSEEAGENEKEKENEKQALFAFMIGNYCVRRFLECAERRLKLLTSPATPPSPHSPLSSSPPSPEIKTKISNLRKKLRKKPTPTKEKHNTAQQNSPSPRRMMFGEISPDPSTEDEKSLLITPKRGTGERWEDGLLWYYGLRRLGAQNAGEVGAEGKGREKEKEERRGCLEVFRRGVAMLRRRIGIARWGRRRWCVGRWGFWALDG